MSSKSRFKVPKHNKFRPQPINLNPDTKKPPVAFAVFKALTVGPFYSGVRALWYVPSFTLGVILSPIFYLGMELRVAIGNRAIRKQVEAAKAVTTSAATTTETPKNGQN